MTLTERAGEKEGQLQDDSLSKKAQDVSQDKHALKGHITDVKTQISTESSEEQIIIKDLANCLLGDQEMRTLILNARDKIGINRLKINMAILLEDFAQHLSVEESFGDLPNFLGARTLLVMDSVFPLLPSTAESSLPLSYDESILARDEIQDLGEVKRKFQQLELSHIKIVHELFDATTIQSSPSFKQLGEELRRFVFPSNRSYIQEMIAPFLPATRRVPIYSIIVRIHWDLPKFLLQELSATDDTAEMVTLTGTLPRAQALTCGDYMHQTWPSSGSQTLEATKYALKHGTSCKFFRFDDLLQMSSTNSLHAPSHSIQLECVENYLAVKIHGRREEIFETLEQFSWLSSCFRSPAGKSVGISQTGLRVIPGPTGSQAIFAELTLFPIREVPQLDVSFGSYWLPLFDRSVLAWGFPVSERGDFYGLELSFELLLKASGTYLPVEFQNSFILRQGVLTVFPTASQDKAIQWHAMLGGLEEFFDKIDSTTLFPVQDDIKNFVTVRHFLGWATQTQVKLATARPTETTSGVNMETGRGFQLGEEITASLSIKPPWIGVNLGTKLLIPRAQMQKFENMQMDYTQLLSRSVRTAALYYDCNTKTGWMVPEISLLLHLVYAHLLKYHPASDVLYEIPYAKLITDGGKAAAETIQSCSATLLWEFQKRGEEKKQYRFQDLVHFYLDCFQNRKEATRLRIEHNELLADLGLRGWDFGDLLDCTAFFRHRLISPSHLSGRPDWWRLAKDPNLLVICGSDLGQLIVPDRSVQRPCSMWAEIPTRLSLLVGPVRCIEDMCRPSESNLPRMQLSKDLCWHQPRDSRPFGDCLGGRCNPVQKLRDISGWGPFHGLNDPQEIMPDGAVIFGLPSVAQTYIESVQQPCHPLPLQASTPGDRVYLRTRPVGFPHGWLYNISRAMKRAIAYSLHFASLIAGIVVTGGMWLVVIRRGSCWVEPLGNDCHIEL